MNVDRAVAPDGVGAGATHWSTGMPSLGSSLSFTGRNVPLVSWVSAGSGAAAWSSRVMLAPVTGCVTVLSPPTSDMMMASAPPGATRSRSRSSG